MDSKKSTPPDDKDQKVGDGQQAPADALSRTPDDLEQEQVKQETPAASADKLAAKKVSPVKRFFRRVNVYFLLFLLIVAVAAAYSIVSYLNSQKVPEVPAIESQGLTEDALKQLANTDATVGNASQTLNIQGNAIIAGQTLMRGNLNVAGNFQSGGSIQAPSLTISGESNLGTAQINSLQVAQDVAIQGATTMQGLSVAGDATFGAAVTASQITVTRLILSGNASLEVPNHISFPGPAPGRAINPSVLGSGGSASVDGSDTTGTVNINSGNSPTPGCFARINFRERFTNKPHVIVSPVGRAAGQTQYYVDRDNDGFSICTGNAAPANQTFAFDYFVTN